MEIKEIMERMERMERIDDLHRCGYKIIQDPREFCFGSDAALLSSFARVYENETALDLGTGTAAIPILLSAKTKGKLFYGIEIQERLADMASRSVALNNLENRIKIIRGDLRGLEKYFKKSTFNVITANPPYFKIGSGKLNDYPKKAAARHEILCSLEDVAAQSAAFLQPNGRFYMIHIPERIAEIFFLLKKYNLEPKKLRLVCPKINREPTMILIEAVRGGKESVRVLPPLIMFGDDGKYTEEIYKIYFE
jgi:tRNA1(Val) A37 N6-methylase TrmN6